MQQYKNKGHNSNVIAFEIGPDYIKVKFSNNKIYLYTYQSAGIQYIEKMKMLAQNGIGLNAFIINYTKKLYSKIE